MRRTASRRAPSLAAARSPFAPHARMASVPAPIQRRTSQRQGNSDGRTSGVGLIVLEEVPIDFLVLGMRVAVSRIQEQAWVHWLLGLADLNACLQTRSRACRVSGTSTLDIRDIGLKISIF